MPDGTDNSSWRDLWEDYRNNKVAVEEEKQKDIKEQLEASAEILKKMVQQQQSLQMQKVRLSDEVQQEPDQNSLGELYYDPKKNELFLIPNGKRAKDKIIIKNMNDFMKIVTIRLLKK